MGLDGLFAEIELAGGQRGGLAVGEALEDLALTAGQLAAAALGGTAGSMKLSWARRRFDRSAQLARSPAVRAT